MQLLTHSQMDRGLQVRMNDLGMISRVEGLTGPMDVFEGYSKTKLLAAWKSFRLSKIL